MLTAALVFAGLAALLHVYIFWLEALAFATDGRKAFGIGSADVPAVAPWAFNQGFYNLFLAIETGVGVAIAGAHRDPGIALVVAGTGSMLAAALVLVASNPGQAGGAAIQGTFPLLALGSLAIWAWA